MTKFTFKVEEIFEEIPGDPDNVIMRIPPELMSYAGWAEGDTLNIEIEDDAIIIEKHG